MSRGDDAKKNTRSFRLPVNVGLNSDGFGEDVPLHDLNNFVLTPDGSALKPREGFEIRRNDAIGYSSGRKLISFMSNPPDIDYGDMIMVTNTKNGRAFVELTEVVRGTNTVSLENPMSMPELPNITEATKNAVLLFAEDSDSGGTSFWKVMLWDDANQKVLGPTLLNVDIQNGTYNLLRSTSYFVTYQRDDVAGLRFKVWDIDAMVANPSQVHSPLKTISVLHDVFVSKICVWMYKNDIAYVLADLDPYGSHDLKLFTVNLKTDAVSSISVTGFQLGIGLNSGGYGSMPVGKDGHLWGLIYDEFPNRHIYKIDPETGICTNGDSITSDQFAQYSTLLNNGSMFNTDNTGSNSAFVTNNNLETIRTTLDNDVRFENWYTVHTNCAINDKAVMATRSDVYLVSLPSAAIVGTIPTLKYQDVWTPSSVYHDGEKVAVVLCDYDMSSDTYSADLVFVDASDGSVVATVSMGNLDTQDLPIYSLSWSPVGDAWGYGIQNIQGAVS